MATHVTKSDGMTLYYKGVGPELRSPVRLNALTYRPGRMVTAPSLDMNPHLGCGRGINYCATIEQAATWAAGYGHGHGYVVALTIPKGEAIVRAVTGSKIRSKRVQVVSRVARVRRDGVVVMESV